MISSPPVNSSPSCLVEVKQDNFTAYKICGVFVYIKSITRTLLVENTEFQCHFVLLKGNKALSTYQEISSFNPCLPFSCPSLKGLLHIPSYRNSEIH